VTCFTSGDPAKLRTLLPRLLGESAEIQKVRWMTAPDQRLQIIEAEND